MNLALSAEERCDPRGMLTVHFDGARLGRSARNQTALGVKKQETRSECGT